MPYTIDLLLKVLLIRGAEIQILKDIKMKTVNIIDNESYQDLLNRIETIDEKLTSILKSKGDRKKWLTNKEVCEILSVTPRTLQNYRDNGLLSFSKAGSIIYYKEEDIEDFLINHYNRGFNSK